MRFVEDKEKLKKTAEELRKKMIEDDEIAVKKKMEEALYNNNIVSEKDDNIIKEDDNIIKEDKTEDDNIIKEDKTEDDNIIKEDNGITVEKVSSENKEKHNPFSTLEKAIGSNKKGNGKSSKQILDSLVIDLTDIQIVEAPKIERHGNIKEVLDQSASFQVVALRSGYTAAMSGLTFKDKDILKNSNLDPYNQRKKFYSIVHDKISSTSVGNLTFSEFLKITAYQDIDTLLFGIYNQSWSTETEFEVSCRKCKGPNKLKINTNSFIEIKDDKVFSYIDEVINGQNKPMDLIGNSLVHKTERIILKNSKLIFDIITPNLEDHLKVLNNYNAHSMKDQNETIGAMTFIKRILVPNINEIKRTGRAVYDSVEDFFEMFNIVNSLKEDGEQLNDAINERENKHAVNYRIKSRPCMHCKEDLGDIPIDMESLVFFRLMKAEK